MHNRRYIILLVFALLLLPSCRQERYAYVNNAPRNEEMEITNNYTTTIFPGDLLYIYVHSQLKTSVLPFNEETKTVVRDELGHTASVSPQVKGYLIDDSGMVQFPLLGPLVASGLTLEEFGREIEGRLKEGRYVKDPIVTVSLMNFRVTVIGEVTRPGLIHGTGNRMTIFEALARCGDITIDGLRTNVTVVRQGDGNVLVDTLDLTQKSAFDSPCYYLHSGDIIYVEPRDKKKRLATRSEEWPKYATTTASVLRLAYLIYYRYAVIGDKLDKK